MGKATAKMEQRTPVSSKVQRRNKLDIDPFGSVERIESYETKIGHFSSVGRSRRLHTPSPPSCSVRSEMECPASPSFGPEERAQSRLGPEVALWGIDDDAKSYSSSESTPKKQNEKERSVPHSPIQPTQLRFKMRINDIAQSQSNNDIGRGLEMHMDDEKEMD